MENLKTGLLYAFPNATDVELGEESKGTLRDAYKKEVVHRILYFLAISSQKACFLQEALTR